MKQTWLKSIFSIQILYHALLWLGYALLSAAKDLAFYQFFYRNFKNDLILSLMIMGYVYFNMYYLVPKFLLPRKYARYLGIALPLMMLNSLLISITLTYYSSPFFISAAGIFSTFTDILLLNIFTTTIAILHAWYKKEKYSKELEKKNLETEIKYLKVQINPHFLFNTLNNIYFSIPDHPEVAQEIVLGLSDMLSHQLYDAHQHRVPLSKELEYLEKYIELEKIRQGDIVRVNYDFPKNADQVEIAPLLLLPFVENAFKHGNKTGELGYWVDIKVVLNHTRFDFVVQNSFQAKENPKDESNKGGIGLENVRRRLILGYPQKHILNIHSFVIKPSLSGEEEELQTYEEQVFEVELSMQLEPSNNQNHGKN